MHLHHVSKLSLPLCLVFVLQPVDVRGLRVVNNVVAHTLQVRDVYEEPAYGMMDTRVSLASASCNLLT
jgi:hypothetical protein